MSDLNDFMNEPDGGEPEGAEAGKAETTPGKEQGVKPLKPFLAQLPDKYKTNEHLGKFNSWGEVVDDYFEKMSKVPQVPEKPEEYEIPDLSKGVKYLNGFDKAFALWAKESGLSKEQAKAFHGQWIKGLEMAQEEQKKAMEATDKILRKDWGSDYDKNKEFAIRAAGQFAGGEFAKLISDTGLRENPIVIKTFAEIGRAISEDTAIPGSGGGTPPSGKEEIEEKMLDEIYPDMKDLEDNVVQ